jgi:hypothetical protein
MAQVNLSGFGYVASVDVSADKTLALSDCGTVQNVTASKTITLPATVVGENHIVRVGAADITVTIAPNASDKIAGYGFTATDAKSAIFTNAAIGSYVELIADGVNGWMFGKVHDPSVALTRAA